MLNRSSSVVSLVPDRGRDEGALGLERRLHPLLEAPFAHEEDDVHRLALPEPVDAGDPLGQDGRVPRGS
jgi:hypothetical protein